MLLTLTAATGTTKETMPLPTIEIKRGSLPP